VPRSVLEGMRAGDGPSQRNDATMGGANVHRQAESSGNAGAGTGEYDDDGDTLMTSDDVLPSVEGFQELEDTPMVRLPCPMHWIELIHYRSTRATSPVKTTTLKSAITTYRAVVTSNKPAYSRRLANLGKLGKLGKAGPMRWTRSYTISP
jgi:hypothetical protein